MAINQRNIRKFSPVTTGIGFAGLLILFGILYNFSAPKQTIDPDLEISAISTPTIQETESSKDSVSTTIIDGSVTGIQSTQEDSLISQQTLSDKLYIKLNSTDISGIRAVLPYFPALPDQLQPMRQEYADMGKYIKAFGKHHAWIEVYHQNWSHYKFNIYGSTSSCVRECYVLEWTNNGTDDVPIGSPYAPKYMVFVGNEHSMTPYELVGGDRVPKEDMKIVTINGQQTFIAHGRLVGRDAWAPNGLSRQISWRTEHGYLVYLSGMYTEEELISFAEVMVFDGDTPLTTKNIDQLLETTESFYTLNSIEDIKKSILPNFPIIPEQIKRDSVLSINGANGEVTYSFNVETHQLESICFAICTEINWWNVIMTNQAGSDDYLFSYKDAYAVWVGDDLGTPEHLLQIENAPDELVQSISINGLPVILVQGQYFEELDLWVEGAGHQISWRSKDESIVHLQGNYTSDELIDFATQMIPIE